MRLEHTGPLCAQRFPQWMWRNRSVERFVAWLRAHNLALPEAERTRRAVGLYGMGEGPIQFSLQGRVSGQCKGSPCRVYHT